MYGRVTEPWWLRFAAPIVAQTNQIYVYMQVVRGRFVEIYLHIALQASPLPSSLEAVLQPSVQTQNTSLESLNSEA